MNLLKADFYHLIKDKLFYVMLAIAFVLPAFTCLMYSTAGGGAAMTVESVIFQGLGTDILCVLIGIQLSSFIGKDYSNNTIRNKICYGENRFKIAYCYFIEAIVITLAFVLVSFCSSMIFGSIFGKFMFSSDFALKLLCQILLLLSFTVVITAVIVSTKSIKAGFIVTILVSVLLTAVSYLLPTLAINNEIFAVICRVLYMIVSSMLISSTNGVYTVGRTESYAFSGLYLNAILIFVVYTIISLVITTLVVRKQNYK
jgi:hypothetical protein